MIAPLDWQIIIYTRVKKAYLIYKDSIEFEEIYF